MLFPLTPNKEPFLSFFFWDKSGNCRSLYGPSKGEHLRFSCRWQEQQWYNEMYMF